ncbi:MAG: helix-turn-helix transcriptional regulator [Lachnospiraceae bacterium]|nr:helix-turn-helix transcriptional regulator [Lachnospiraceae bacterium]
MLNVVDKEIAKLQNNLQAIRKIAGWTTEELGEQIGVTKQTISNLENHKTTMTKTQYIALRTVIDYEIATNTDNATLGQVVNALLNSDDEDDESETAETKAIDKKEYVEAVKTITATANAKDKTKKAAMSAGAMAAVGSTLMTMAANPLIIGLTAEWMSKIITGKKK